MKQCATIALGLLAFAALHCGDGASDCAETNTCASSPDASDDTSSGGVDGGPDGTVPIPEGCDPNADPKDAPKCVVSDYGIFVDATAGNDGNSGSKELPLKSIDAATKKLNGRPRIYVCEGTYAESVKLTSPISIFGGFACGTWTYTGVQPKVAPGVAGAEAIAIENVKSSVVISDMHADAAPGDATKKNSIAMRIVGSTDVKLVRVKITAGAGFKGLDGQGGSTGALDKAPGGNAADGATPGAAKVCTCTSGGETSGGGGGAAGIVGQPGGDAKLPANPTGSDGAGGVVVPSCSGQEPNGAGNSGATAPAAANAPSPTTLGQIVESSWVPTAGAKGTAGLPGQGGGGGAGNTNGGGGGACGGCGGTGGEGGAGGGASVGILAIDSFLAIAASTATVSDGGPGGAGGVGGNGAAGGLGGPGLCAGGDGGSGGKGGGGSGGSGGVSVGILWTGTEPTRDAATDAGITVGTAGAGGQGGAPGLNDGPPGKAEKMMGL